MSESILCSLAAHTMPLIAKLQKCISGRIVTSVEVRCLADNMQIIRHFRICSLRTYIPRRKKGGIQIVVVNACCSTRLRSSLHHLNALSLLQHGQPEELAPPTVELFSSLALSTSLLI